MHYTGLSPLFWAMIKVQVVKTVTYLEQPTHEP